LTVEYADVFTAIRYHFYYPDASDPYYRFNIGENSTRYNYYQSNYVPHLLIDGYIDGEANRGAWEGMIDNESFNVSPIAMEMWGTYDADIDSGVINVRIITEEDPGLTSLRLRLALTESNINWRGPNGTVWHHQTFRDMIPSCYGQPVTLVVGDTLEYSLTFHTPSPLVGDNCHLVAFVQSEQNREIIQGAWIAIPDLTPTGIDDPIHAPRQFALKQNYPNPFNAATTIEFETPGGPVRLEVFDITGTRIAMLVDENLQAGRHSVTWNAPLASSGTYFYRLRDASGSSVKKMTLLK
jgi:hypothetical protein